MFGKFGKQLWFTVALSTLTIFCFILAAHSLIPHEHAHDMTGSGVLSALHSGVNENKLTVVLLTAVFLFARITPPNILLISRMFVRFAAQGPEVRLLLPLARAASAGLLNPRAY